MTSLGFYFDSNRCIGCKSCESACVEWNGEQARGWRQVVSTEQGAFPDVRRAHLSMACNNCEAAPCLKACPTAALYIDPRNNTVQLDQKKCIGCRYCVWACPYGALQFDQEKKTVSKCTLCSDRVAANLQPACVSSCPTGCLQFGDIGDFQKEHPAATPDFPGLEESHCAAPRLLLSKPKL